ncbi:Y-family DNA polymerase [Oryzifoliimicrobium ureilyticus]|uniref:Y-family DNA polymerase n=1 Tax=Oryzifoliimicrobium ureilyticus TaxID=3113724 RepID=UPI0030766429
MTGRPDAAPIVCFGPQDNALRLTALDEKAELIGLRKGQGVTEARAICPHIALHEEDAAANRRLLEAIADWCDRYTPLVSIDGKDGLFLDITGCSHLFGGEKAMLDNILTRLFQMGFDVRGAISSSAALSFATARFGHGGIIEDNAIEETAAPLSVAALRLEEPTLAALRKLGLKHIGDLLHLPRASLARRFGLEVLLRLDRVLGLDEEPLSPRLPVAPLSAERRLAEPVGTVEVILDITRQIAAALKPSLEAKGLGGRVFELVLFRVDGRVFRISAGASRPLREEDRITSLFSERLNAIQDDMDAGYGFETLRLNVKHHDLFQNVQDDFEGDRQGQASLAAFIDKVTARLGRDCLKTYDLRESHVPESAVVAVAAMDALAAADLSKKPLVFPHIDRPVRLLDHPERVDAFAAEVPDGAPSMFRWRRISHKILKSEGPERITSEWWLDERANAERDYFRVEDQEGHRLWIYREGLYENTEPTWYVHGFFV